MSFFVLFWFFLFMFLVFLLISTSSCFRAEPWLRMAVTAALQDSGDAIDFCCVCLFVAAGEKFVFHLEF